MILTLLIKDWARIRRKPGQYLLMLLMPISITAIIGMAFSPSNSGSGLPAIRVAIADEDQNLISGLVSNALTRTPVEIVPEPMAFDEALALIQEGEYSAVIRIPKGFTSAFFSRGSLPAMELVKNPTQRFLPAVVEETMMVLAEALNALSRNLSEELGELNAALGGSDVPDPVLMGTIAQKVFAKFQSAGDYLTPLIIQYEQEKRSNPEAESTPTNLFGFLLPSIAAMFLLFLADIGMRDFYEENRMKTLERYRTLNVNAFPFVLSKALLAMSVVLVGAFILLGLGGLLFGVTWSAPGPIAILVVTYAAYAAGLLALVSALLGTEKRADVVNSLLIFGMGFMGGSMLPVENMPKFISEMVSPYMPTYWFGRGVVALQYDQAGPDWAPTAIKMLVIGLALLILATWMINRRLAKGVK